MRGILLGLESVEYFELDSVGQIVAANRAFARRMGTVPGELVGKRAVKFLAEGDARKVVLWLDGAAPPAGAVLLNFVTPDGEVYTHRCLVTLIEGGLALAGEADVENERWHASQLLQLNNEMAVISRERARYSKELSAAKKALSETLDTIRSTHWHLKRIQEHLPVCMECGRIRVDGTRWAGLVDYLKANDILVTHGCCPECVRELEVRWGLDVAPTGAP
jgi:PAS domain-containing protein